MPRRFWNALEEAYLVDAYPDTPTALAQGRGD